MKGMMMMKLKIFAMLLMISSYAVEAQNSANGTSNEDALKVQNELYDPPIRVDAKTVQRQVYKNVFKKEMKETAPVAEPAIETE